MNYENLDISPELNTVFNPNMPEIKWNISGFGCHNMVLMDFLKLLERAHGLQVVKSIHGSPNCIWNGGRPSLYSFDGNVEQVIKELNNMGVGVYLTFTNRLIENRHLSDHLGNYLLDVIYERPDLNGVIVVSDILSDYIRKTKPLMKQFCSIVKITMEKGMGNIDYYKEMEKRFDLVVAHPDDVFDLEFMDKLDRKKTEILVNEPCVYKCPFRAQHYDIFAAHNIENDFEYLKVNTDFRAKNCNADKAVERLSKELPHRNCYLTIDDVQGLYDMGFRHFKLRGRDEDALMFMYEVIGFVLHPKLQYLIQMQHIMSFIMTVQQQMQGMQQQIQSMQQQSIMQPGMSQPNILKSFF